MKNPVVGVMVDERIRDRHPTYIVLAKYIQSLIKFAGVTPILIPPVASHELIQEHLQLVDGILLTGSPSDVHPSNYGHEIKNPDSFFDKNRDETSLNLIRNAVVDGIPVLGICRGFQEINVALGGTLHQSIHRTPNYMDHREVVSEDLSISYGKRHSIILEPQGKLMKLLNHEKWMVNSLHDQGIDSLADSLRAEARAEDGLIEAVSLKDEAKFVFAAQWHFEWEPQTDQCSLAIFKAFGDACKQYRYGKK